jgi:hypothetical protein
VSIGQDVERAVAARDFPREPSSERVALVDLLDRLLAGGVVIVGDVVISIAGIDLVRVSLRALITTVQGECNDIVPH